jgi:hypothetical protein
LARYNRFHQTQARGAKKGASAMNSETPLVIMKGGKIYKNILPK